jgi:uncharacterized membrane protein YccC
MSLSKFIKNLEKRGIVSRKPDPIIPFILSLIILILGISVSYMNLHETFSNLLFFLAGFSFIFAILHLIVVRILEGRS